MFLQRFCCSLCKTGVSHYILTTTQGHIRTDQLWEYNVVWQVWLYTCIICTFPSWLSVKSTANAQCFSETSDTCWCTVSLLTECHGPGAPSLLLIPGLELCCRVDELGLSVLKGVDYQATIAKVNQFTFWNHFACLSSSSCSLQCWS